VSTDPTTREALLRELARFVRAAIRVRGVMRIAVVGSLTTAKIDPKDADVLVTIAEDADVRALAALGRKLKGVTQSRNKGADIFLASSDGRYLGRTCGYRECHPRVACRGQQCGRGLHICNDLHDVDLDARLVAEPPVELWPQIVLRVEVPTDMRQLLIEDPHRYRAAQQPHAAIRER